MQKTTVFVLIILCLFSFSCSVWALELKFKDDKAMDVWTAVGGQWEIKKSLLEGRTTGYQDLMLNVEGADGWTDYTFEVKGMLNAGRIWGMCFRYADTLNNYRLNLYEDLDATNNLYIYKRVTGNFSEVFKVGVGTIDKDKWYTLKLTITKNTIQAYLDGDLKIEAEDKAGGLDVGTIALEGETNTVFLVEYVTVDGKGIPSSPVESNGKLASAWGSIKSQ